MEINAKIIEDSAPKGWKPTFALKDSTRLITFQLSYPRYIHAEFMTHRVFSRNAASSRAIPVIKELAKVIGDPTIPTYWGKNQPGMQAGEELQGLKLALAKFSWKASSKSAAFWAYIMYKLGVHKQVTNRVLEPYLFIDTVMTTSYLENFIHLRKHPDAQPEIQILATKMLEAVEASYPKLVHTDKTVANNWHLPYITEVEIEEHRRNPVLLAAASSARCARVSYRRHDAASVDVYTDLERFYSLVCSSPQHSSPVEHQAFLAPGQGFNKNFAPCWAQFRYFLDNAAFDITMGIPEIAELIHKMDD